MNNLVIQALYSKDYDLAMFFLKNGANPLLTCPSEHMSVHSAALNCLPNMPVKYYGHILDFISQHTSLAEYMGQEEIGKKLLVRSITFNKSINDEKRYLSYEEKEDRGNYNREETIKRHKEKIEIYDHSLDYINSVINDYQMNDVKWFTDYNSKGLLDCVSLFKHHKLHERSDYQHFDFTAAQLLFKKIAMHVFDEYVYHDNINSNYGWKDYKFQMHILPETLPLNNLKFATPFYENLFKYVPIEKHKELFQIIEEGHSIFNKSFASSLSPTEKEAIQHNWKAQEKIFLLAEAPKKVENVIKVL